MYELETRAWELLEREAVAGNYISINREADCWQAAHRAMMAFAKETAERDRAEIERLHDARPGAGG